MVSSTLFTKAYKPVRPYATNSFSHGVFRRERSEAFEMKYIQPNNRGNANFMVFDVDDVDAESVVKSKAFDDSVIPVPAWITVNPHSGHAHVGYRIKGFAGTDKGKAFFNDVRARLNIVLGGDPAYGGFTTRNPLVNPTEWIDDYEYSLKELNAFTDGVRKVKAPVEFSGGRNDIMFTALRKYAYNIFRHLKYNEAALSTALESRALELYYSEFEDLRGFPLSEVYSIVKSVVKWTVNNFSEEAFANIQRKRAMKRWGNSRVERAENAIFMRDEMKLSWAEVASHLGCSVGAAKTVYYRGKRAL